MYCTVPDEIVNVPLLDNGELAVRANVLDPIFKVWLESIVAELTVTDEPKVRVVGPPPAPEALKVAIPTEVSSFVKDQVGLIAAAVV